MTAQIDDSFLHHGIEYSIAGISAGKILDMPALGLRPTMGSTACWRGYQAVFALQEERLVLERLDVNLFEGGEGWPRGRELQGPVLNGVTPRPGPSGSFNNRYEGLGLPLEYSGGVLLGIGFIHELYVHMGFHPAWKYERVVELVFERGILLREADRSRQLAEFRGMMSARALEPGAEASPEDIARFVEETFDRSYRF